MPIYRACPTGYVKLINDLHESSFKKTIKIHSWLSNTRHFRMVYKRTYLSPKVVEYLLFLKLFLLFTFPLTPMLYIYCVS